jgi:ATP-dependent DNA helicase RecQ
VLDDWARDLGLDGIVAMCSASRPELVAHLADGLSRYTGLPVLATFVLAPGAGPTRTDVNSAHRLAQVADRFSLPDEPGVKGRTVLLVDDRARTGWTLAVAARLLRRAGADDVFPFVLADGE